MDANIRNTPPPSDWGTTVSVPAIERLADRWKHRTFPLPKWDYKGLPRGLDDPAWYTVCVTACSVLACIWPPEGDEMWTTSFEGDELDDAPAIFSCFSRQIADGELDLRVFSRLTPEEFFAGRGTLQLLDERWLQLDAVVAALDDQWQGAAANLVADGQLDAELIVELLVATIPGFDDAPESSRGRLQFHKLARLATAMMSAGGTQPFIGLERLPVYPDYMLPRVFRHFGIIEYSPELAATVDGRGLVPRESEWELGIRWATVYCGDQLATALRNRGSRVSTPALDYALWESAVLGPDADAMGEHHRTVTLAY